MGKTLFCACSFFVLLLFNSTHILAQPLKLTEYPIALEGDLAKSVTEISGIAQRGNQILFIAQNCPDNFLNKIYSVDSPAINNAIRDKNYRVQITSTYYFKGLKEFKDNIAAIGEAYGGIEGAVVVGNDIYFTVETQTQTCYVVKGTFTKSRDSNIIVIDTVNYFAISKPAFFSNAGFESITYNPVSKRLTVFFERNCDTSDRSIVSMSTSFKEDTYTRFTLPLLFRLTDASCDSAGVLLGIQHHYHKSAAELDFYGCADKEQAKDAMNGMHPQLLSYTGIVRIYPENTFKYETIGDVSYATDNWEGILQYRTGFLLVTDGLPGNVVKLSFFELPKASSRKRSRLKH